MAIADALREMFGAPEATQESIAERLTAGGFSVKQPKVSSWLRGARTPTLDQIAELERIYERPRGWVLQTVGMVDSVAIIRQLAVDLAGSLAAAEAHLELDRLVELLDQVEAVLRPE